jgi:hypothetical protein
LLSVGLVNSTTTSTRRGFAPCCQLEVSWQPAAEQKHQGFARELQACTRSFIVTIISSAAACCVFPPNYG